MGAHKLQQELTTHKTNPEASAYSLLLYYALLQVEKPIWPIQYHTLWQALTPPPSQMPYPP
jgi:hypothetical protein